MNTKKASASVPGIITKAVLCIAASVFVVLALSGMEISPKAVAGFAFLVFIIQFIDTMLGSNPIGMVMGAVVSIFCLIILKTTYSYPHSWLSEFFVSNIIVIAPAMALIDILRDIID